MSQTLQDKTEDPRVSEDQPVELTQTNMEESVAGQTTDRQLVQQEVEDFEEADDERERHFSHEERISPEKDEL